MPRGHSNTKSEKISLIYIYKHTKVTKKLSGRHTSSHTQTQPHPPHLCSATPHSLSEFSQQYIGEGRESKFISHLTWHMDNSSPIAFQGGSHGFAPTREELTYSTLFGLRFHWCCLLADFIGVLFISLTISFCGRLISRVDLLQHFVPRELVKTAKIVIQKGNRWERITKSEVQKWVVRKIYTPSPVL